MAGRVEGWGGGGLWGREGWVFVGVGCRWGEDEEEIDEGKVDDREIKICSNEVEINGYLKHDIKITKKTPTPSKAPNPPTSQTLTLNILIIDNIGSPVNPNSASINNKRKLAYVSTLQLTNSLETIKITKFIFWFSMLERIKFCTIKKLREMLR